MSMSLGIMAEGPSVEVIRVHPNHGWFGGGGCVFVRCVFGILYVCMYQRLFGCSLAKLSFVYRELRPSAIISTEKSIPFACFLRCLASHSCYSYIRADEMLSMLRTAEQFQNELGLGFKFGSCLLRSTFDYAVYICIEKV